MPLGEFAKARMAMEMLKARDAQIDLAVSDYPHLKAHSRKQTYEAFKRQSEQYAPKKVMSMDQLFEALNG